MRWRSSSARSSRSARSIDPTDTTSASIRAGPRARASRTTSISTWCRGGTATRTSCPSSARCASCRKRSTARGNVCGVVSVADLGSGLTPMMAQYRELKQRYPDFLLLFRLGDFYELFFDDAEEGAKLLSIALTSRQGAPMAGIPHHAAETYIARLVQAGRKIAICEQMEAPSKGKKLLRRDVVRVVTPGTITDTAYLTGGVNNFLLAMTRGREGTGVALVDVSTGEFWAGEDLDLTPMDSTARGGQMTGGQMNGVLAAALLRRPAEVVLPESCREASDLHAQLGAHGATLSFCDPSMFGGRRAGAELC